METRSSSVTVNLEVGELYLLNNALNEVCNGLHLDAFATRMGCERSVAAALLAQFHAMLERFESPPG